MYSGQHHSFSNGDLGGCSPGWRYCHPPTPLQGCLEYLGGSAKSCLCLEGRSGSPHARGLPWFPAFRNFSFGITPKPLPPLAVNFVLTTFDPLREGGGFGLESFRVRYGKQSIRASSERLCWWYARHTPRRPFPWQRVALKPLSPAERCSHSGQMSSLLSLGIECVHSSALAFQVHPAQKYKTMLTEKTKGNTQKYFHGVFLDECFFTFLCLSCFP